MKIGVVSGIFHPEPGGVATYLHHLLPHFVAVGHEVRLLTYGESTQDDYGYTVRRISRRGGRLRRFAHFTRESLALAQWADVLYVVGYALPLPLMRLFTRRIVLRVVADAAWEYADRNKHTTLDVQQYQSAKLPPLLEAYRRYYHFAVRRADAIIMPSEHVARLVRGWGVPPHKLHVIYNAVPDPGLSDTPRESLRRELGLPLDVPLLVSIARLTPVKGVDVALTALPMIGHDAKLIIVGDGPQQAALEAMAPAGRALFVGHQDHDQALRYLRAADVFVLSSRTEGLSHVLLEALAVRTPAVATRVGGNPEVLIHDQDGLLVPPEDPRALADAINRLLDHPDEAARLSRAGAYRSIDFSWPRTVAGTLAVLETVARRGASPL